MKIVVFAKKRTTKEGKAFTAYVTKLTKKDGSEVVASVKFREECGAPKDVDCPCYIEFDKSHANISEKHLERVDPDSGEIVETVSKTLWISAWKATGEKYVDHSLDDFE